MNRVNIIQFIMFLTDLARFALISGSSVSETLWSWREKKNKDSLSALNWEPQSVKETQQLCQPFTSQIYLPKSIRQHSNWCSLYDCCTSSLSEDLKLNGVISSADKMLKYEMRNQPFCINLELKGIRQMCLRMGTRGKVFTLVSLLHSWLYQWK